VRVFDDRNGTGAKDVGLSVPELDDGRESRTKTSLGEGQSRAHWNGLELIIDSVLETPNRTLHFSDHWSLSSDGLTPKMPHRDDDLAGQIAVFEKAPADVAARFKPQ
jgi:hypothetical protein